MKEITLQQLHDFAATAYDGTLSEIFELDNAVG